MEIYTMTRPSMSLTPVCAPVALVPAGPAVMAVLAERLPVTGAHKALLAPETAPISRVHQVQLQAELTLVRGGFDGINGTTSTTGSEGNDVAMKRNYADSGKGVPPRGRPV